jgi:adenylate kinase family enzyme
MKRILIIGSPGAGKSTLACALTERTGLPLHHLDWMSWLPGWIERDRDETRALLATVLEQDRWIIDGNYGSSLPLRLTRADTVIWLDYPTVLCLWRVVRRLVMYRGRSRPDMTEGCPERFDHEFLLYVLHFRTAWRGRNRAALERFEGTILSFGSSNQCARWLAGQPGPHAPSR